MSDEIKKNLKKIIDQNQEKSLNVANALTNEDLFFTAFISQLKASFLRESEGYTEQIKQLKLGHIFYHATGVIFDNQIIEKWNYPKTLVNKIILIAVCELLIEQKDMHKSYQVFSLTAWLFQNMPRSFSETEIKNYHRDLNSKNNDVDDRIIDYINFVLDRCESFHIKDVISALENNSNIEKFNSEDGITCPIDSVSYDGGKEVKFTFWHITNREKPIECFYSYSTLKSRVSNFRK